MFTGKESSNRIKLSRLVQDLLNFGVWAPCSSREWGVCGWGHRGVGCPHTCAHAHTHTHTCKEVTFFQMLMASVALGILNLDIKIGRKV